MIWLYFESPNAVGKSQYFFPSIYILKRFFCRQTCTRTELLFLLKSGKTTLFFMISFFSEITEILVFPAVAASEFAG